MSSENGHGKIEIDFNRITRLEWRQWLSDTTAARQKGDGLRSDELTGELVERIVVSWSYDKPITKDGYLSLPLPDSRTVDQLLSEAIIDISEKKA